MSTIGRYMQVHLTGAAAGIDLFRISGEGLTDPTARSTVTKIAAELLDERSRLVRMAEEAGNGDPRLLSLVTRLGAQATRLGPNGDWLRHNALTDLTVLETMRDAVAGKIGGWEALLVVADEHDFLDRGELEALLEQGRRQHEELSQSHRDAARRAFACH